MEAEREGEKKEEDTAAAVAISEDAKASEAVKRAKEDQVEVSEERDAKRVKTEEVVAAEPTVSEQS